MDTGHVSYSTIALAGRAPERDVHVRGHDALERYQLVDVAAELENRPRLHVAGELGVDHLVVEGAEPARSIGGVDAPEEVGVAAPGAVETASSNPDSRTSAT